MVAVVVEVMGTLVTNPDKQVQTFDALGAEYAGQAVTQYKIL